MFFGSTSTIISIIFGLGLQWILIVAGQDLVHKLLHRTSGEPSVEISTHVDVFHCKTNCIDAHFYDFIDRVDAKTLSKMPVPLSGRRHAVFYKPNLFLDAFALRGPPIFA